MGRSASAGVLRAALLAVVGLTVVVVVAFLALRGPSDGTTTMAGVADELPPGLVLDGATDVESTVARRGEAISAAVTYVVDRSVDDVLTGIDDALGGDWQRRSTSSDGTTEQVLYDGPAEATLTVSARASTGGTGVAAVLARS